MMNNIFDKIAQTAHEEELANENAALKLAPSELGRSGGCHVVAMILKRIFPNYRVVGFVRENGLASHVGCALGNKFVDINSIKDLPDAVIDCEPISGTNPVYRGFLMREGFVSAATSSLEPFIRDHLESYTITNAETNKDVRP